MKNIIWFVVFFVACFDLNAQHCPFDAEGILVVKIHTNKDTNLIPHLRITLLDSINKPVLQQDWAYSKFLGDTIRLWQNVPKSSFKGEIDGKHPANPREIRFPFALDNYILVCPIFFDIENYKLKIEDTDGNKNGGCFTTAIVQLKKENLYSLCGTYKSAVYFNRSDDTITFAPIEISLIKL